MGRALAVSLRASKTINNLTSGNVVASPGGEWDGHRGPLFQLHLHCSERGEAKLCVSHQQNFDQGGACVRKAT